MRFDYLCATELKTKTIVEKVLLLNYGLDGGKEWHLPPFSFLASGYGWQLEIFI